MRTLYLVPYTIDPPNSGTRVRALGIRAALDALGVVTVAALDEVARVDSWGAMCRAMVARRGTIKTRVLDRSRATLFGTPALLERALAAGAIDAFRVLLSTSDPELVVLSRPCFGPFIDAARSTGASVVIDADESLVRAMGSVARSRAPAIQRLRAAMDGANASRFERREYRRVDQVWVSSPVEQAYFAKLLPNGDVQAIPNLAPGSDSSVDDGAHTGRPTAIAFVGTYSYAPNEEAALELMRSIMPALDGVGLDLPLRIIGRDPTPAMFREAARHPKVGITGTVDDPVSELRRAGLTLVPIRSGAGSRIKILEAMAAGVPVVSTSKGYEGLAVRPDLELLRAETSDEFARATLRLESDPALRFQLVQAARRFVEESHSQAAVSISVSNAVASLGGRSDNSNDASRCGKCEND